MRIRKGQHAVQTPAPVPVSNTLPDAPPTMPSPGPLPRSRSRTIEISGQTAIVRPGDTLIIATNRQLNQAEAAELRYHVEHQLPGVQALIIAGASALATYRPETT